MAKYYNSNGTTCSDPKKAAYCIVQSGDILSEISLQVFGNANKYSQIASWNGISNPNYIVVGQKIYLSKSGASSSGSSGGSTKKTSSTNTVTIKTFGVLASDDTTLYVQWTGGKPMKETKEFQIVWREYKDGIAFDKTEKKTVEEDDPDWYVGSRQTTHKIESGYTKYCFRIKQVSKTYKVTERVLNETGESAKKEHINNTYIDKYLSDTSSHFYTDKEVEKTYWEANWTNFDDATYIVSNPVPTPEAPKVEIDKNNKLTATMEEQDTSVYTHFKFEIVQNSTTSIKKSDKIALTKIDSKDQYGRVSFQYTVPAGNKYKVRCMGYKDKLTSEWSKFSGDEQARPTAPSEITTCKGSDKGTDGKYTVYLDWTEVASADTYEVQYTTIKEDFDVDIGGSAKKEPTPDEIPNITIKLDSAGEYFFRVRAKNEKGESAWTDIVSVKIGEPPGPPTTWESTTRAIGGEPLSLYWVHNALDGSTQTYARLFLSTDGGKTSESYEIKNDGYYGIDANGSKYLIEAFSENDERKDQTSVCVIDTALFDDGTVLTWWVQTKGITSDLGKCSTYREVDIYEKPNMKLLITDEYTVNEDGSIVLGSSVMDVLEQFPFYIKAVSLTPNQTPIGYSLTITSDSSYETVDASGNTKVISSGDAVYSSHFDISEVLVLKMSADNIDLENGMKYTVSCVMSMDSGLTAEAYGKFTVSWTDEQYAPNAEIAIDYSTYTASIRPYCEDIQTVYKQLTLSDGKYLLSETILDDEKLDDVYTETFEKVYLGANSRGTEMYYCIVYSDSNGNFYETPLYYKVTANSNVYTKTSTKLQKSSISNVYSDTKEPVSLGMIDDTVVYYCESQTSTLVDGITLSVYRREFDGSFTEIATDIKNTNNTFVTDPHPALDYARYRVVARDDTTGAISFYDMPGHPVGGTSIILQWDEEWSSYDQWSDDKRAEPPWAGSLLELPFNVDESDSTNIDVSLVKYIGRKHPVAYYGTHVGETASWSTTAINGDTETIYALRRLAKWNGNVYVRSPSGIGYWAHVKPSFSLKHADLTIPVTLDITRVEGGI